MLTVGLGDIKDGEPLFDKGDIWGSMSPNPPWLHPCCFGTLLFLWLDIAETGDEDADNEPE